MGAEMRSGTPIPAMFFTIPFNTYDKKVKEEEINKKGDEDGEIRRRLRWRMRDTGECGEGEKKRK